MRRSDGGWNRNQVEGAKDVADEVQKQPINIFSK
jgi:hypothetical protein